MYAQRRLLLRLTASVTTSDGVCHHESLCPVNIFDASGEVTHQRRHSVQFKASEGAVVLVWGYAIGTICPTAVASPPVRARIASQGSSLRIHRAHATAPHSPQTSADATDANSRHLPQTKFELSEPAVPHPCRYCPPLLPPRSTTPPPTPQSLPGRAKTFSRKRRTTWLPSPVRLNGFLARLNRRPTEDVSGGGG